MTRDTKAHHQPKPDANLEVETPDGHRFRIMCYHGERAEQAPLLLIWPAMGTRARNYKLLAEALCQRGCWAAVAELRGHGTSSLRARHGCDYGYREMLRQDWEMAVQSLERAYPGRPLYLVGHSLGGQLSLLYAALQPQRTAGVILLAACSVYYRCYGRRSWPFRVLLTMVRPLVGVFGYFPGKRLGFAGREGAQVMRDWASQGKSGRYRIRGEREDMEALLARLRKPVLAIEFVADQLAPPAAVTHLLNKLDQAEISRFSFDVDDARQGHEHFDWFRSPFPIADHVVSWIKARKSN